MKGSAYTTVLKKIFKTSDIDLNQHINQNQPVAKTSFKITQEQLEAINLTKRNKREALPQSKAQDLASNLNIDTQAIGNLSNQQEQENKMQEEERLNKEAEEKIRQLMETVNAYFNKNKEPGSKLTTTQKTINNLNATNNMLQIIKQIL